MAFVSFTYTILLLMSGFISPKQEMTRPSKEECVDLSIDKMYKPEWDADKRITNVTIIVKNTGSQASDTTSIRLSDVEVDGYSDALTAKASFVQYGNKKNLIRQDSAVLLPLMPHESRTITLSLKYWVYDPDCELEVLVDPANKISECRKDNNKTYFLDHGHK
jgi:subtilase family serine protease